MGDNEKKISLSKQREAALKELKALEANLIEGLTKTRVFGYNADFFKKGTSFYMAAEEGKLHDLHKGQIAFLGRISKAIKNIEVDTLRRGGKTAKGDFQNPADADSLAAQYQYIAKQAQVMNKALSFDMQSSLNDVAQWKGFEGDSYIQRLGEAINNSEEIRERVKKEAEEPKQTGSIRSRQTTSGSSSTSSSSSSASSSSSDSTVTTPRDRSVSVTSDDNRDRREKKITSNAITFVQALAASVMSNVKTEGIFRVVPSKEIKSNLFRIYSKETDLNKTDSAHLLEGKDVEKILNSSLKTAEIPVHIFAGSLNDILKDPTLIGLSSLSQPTLRSQMIDDKGNADGAFKEALKSMPASHIKILQIVFQILREIVKNENVTKMKLANIDISVGLGLQRFMGLGAPETPKFNTVTEGMAYGKKELEDNAEVSKVIMGQLEKPDCDAVFNEVLREKHSENQDFSDTEYKNKDELGGKQGFLSIGRGWKGVSRGPAAGKDPVISGPDLTSTSSEQVNNNNNNNGNNF